MVHTGTHQNHQSTGAMALDPVCGMQVDPHGAAWTHVHGGTTYYFCAESCRTKFAQHPELYLDPEIAKAAQQAIPEGTIFTCPMHPEIEQVGPGSC
ncbi:MAG: YHS domain-containing protein, partial [Thermomicrobiales bacterium]